MKNYVKNALKRLKIVEFCKKGFDFIYRAWGQRNFWILIQNQINNFCLMKFIKKILEDWLFFYCFYKNLADKRFEMFKKSLGF